VPRANPEVIEIAIVRAHSDHVHVGSTPDSGRGAFNKGAKMQDNSASVVLAQVTQIEAMLTFEAVRRRSKSKTTSEVQGYRSVCNSHHQPQ
jgi:hypothetical protein